ncbi:c-type cytochrome [Roseobacter ponti]|uniref:C-type cytochrome n=1 Tax=Roseobacter ponti TaxID=1891787 RepID=A0A858SWY6_9RHOB|nr:c-type cytochrome [Roseobacter ponti]QJF52342.1 c-type cytochrome [Roseobacter ponti]
MSKSPEILLPALGVTGIVLGAVAVFSARNYENAEVAVLQGRIAQIETRIDDAASAAATAEEHAGAETARAAALEAKVSEIQAAAAERGAGGLSLTAPAPQPGDGYGLGRSALAEEIAAWDVDVLPDGRGLPEGRGDVFTGEEKFAEACASCHGDFAEGVGNWPVLAGGFDTLARKDPVKTVGSYWPYLSTVWDYVHRSMPFGQAQTLSDDDVYAIVAYILYSNDLVDEDFELSHENFADVEMYNADGFVVDDRPEREYTGWRVDPCMENCKETVSITMRSTFLDVTPEDGGESVMNDASAGSGPVFTAVPAQDAEAGTEAPASDDALIGDGERVFRKCRSCHQIGEGAKNRSGPLLTGVTGRTFGTVDGFKYSDAFEEAATEGRNWTEEEMAAFLENPKEHMPGTRMSFAGLKDDADIAAVIAYLKSFDG